MIVTTIDLLRHGEPVGGRKYRGQTDDPLSDKGWGQMRAAVGEFRGWSQVVTSPLSRCAAFAQELREQRGFPLAYEERFKEVGFGSWEGKTSQQLEAENPGAVFRFKCDPVAHRPDGAEPVGDFFARVAAAWDELLRQYEGGHVLLVSHAGVIRMILAAVLGVAPEKGYRIQVDSAALTRIGVQREGAAVLPNLVFHNAKVVPGE